MTQMVQTNSFGLAAAQADRANLNLYAPKVHLFQNDVVPTPTSGTADLVEADYDGYEPLNSTFGPVFVDSAGGWQTLQTKQFDSEPAGGVTNTIYGAFLTNTLNLLLAAGRFNSPVPMGDVAQSLVVELLRKSGVLTLSQQP